MSDLLHRSSSAPPAEDTAGERRTLRDYYIMLRERLWIALPLALLISIGYGYYKVRETPLFSATSTMQFEKPQRVVLNQEVVDPSITSEIDLNTYLQILGSGRLRQRVVDSFTPEEVRILQRPYLAALLPGEAPPSAGGALGTPIIQSIRNSFLISVSVHHRDPEAAALVANRYVDQFMLHLLESVSGSNEVAVQFLQTRAEELRRDLERAEQRLQDYQRTHNLLSLDGSTNIIQERLLSVNGALQTARLERLAIEDRFNQVEKFRAEGGNLLEIAAIANYGSIPAVRNQLDELRRSQAVLSERYLELHPKMIDTANAIAVAEQQLASALELAVADLRTSLAKARSTEASLEREYRANEQDQIRLRDLAVEYRSLENQALVAKNTYVQILDRLNQTTTSRNLENIPVRPLDRATPAGAPFTPNPRRVLQTSILLFVAVFVGVAVGLSFIDDRIKSTWDVESFVGANLIGIIPELTNVKDEERYSLVLENRQVPGTEAFLGVYSSVKINSKLDFPKSILVTSTIPGEGKTLVSSNLAGSFARHGKKTLLVDCDLRRPMLHRRFNRENASGIIKWFDAGASLEGPLTANPDLGIIPLADNLSLLCSGGRSKTPTQLLESAAFGELLESLKRHYDLIVVDSPPMGAVTDSLLIADRADEVLYVCRFNRAYRKHIRLYMKALRNGKNEILGVVLNGLSPRRIEYYSNYRYYRSYKKYYGTEA